MTPDTQKDFFISYNEADRERAEWIAWQLEEAGYSTIIQEWDFRPGSNFVLEMNRATMEARRTVLVLSPEYLKASYTQTEWAAAFPDDPLGKQGRLLPVRVRKCKVEGLLRTIKYINLVGVDEQLARERLLAGVQRGRAKPTRAPAFEHGEQDAGDEEGLFAGRSFMVEDLPGDFVQRPTEFEELISKLLDKERERPVAITAALRGAGGYGKTTMARAVCHDERVRRAFRDGILWVTLGENLALEKLVGKVEDLIYMLSHERPGFTGLDGAAARLAELLANRDILLVIDDVWDEMHLKPFVQGGTRCARLVTTRDDGVLPAQAQRIAVDAMRLGEAVQLLGAGLDGIASSASEGDALRTLAKRLGEWPLLLKLANGFLRERVGRYRQVVPDALRDINEALDECGLTVFDAENVQDRNRAVALTLGVSIRLLGAEEQARYKELAVFPEDVDIPLVTLQRLWGATGGLSKVKTERLCARLYGLSLLLNCELVGRTIRLHDVVRGYLRSEVGREGLAVLDGQLLDAYGQKRWADVAHDEPYVWEHLAEHLVGAGRGEELVATVKDLRYLATKASVRGAYAAEADLSVAEKEAPSDVVLRLLKRNVANIGHLLNRCETLSQIEGVLHSRLCHLDEFADLCQSLEGKMSRPFLTSWHTLPDLPHPVLMRTLQGHTDWVSSCAVSPAGDYIVSASWDNTLKVWDAHSGEVRLTLEGHTDAVRGCAVSPAGDFIVSASEDKTLKLWDARSGEVCLTLEGHTDWVSGCAVSPAGDFIVSASRDRTLKVWDAHSGEVRLTLEGHTDWVSGCAVSPAGDYIVSASRDNTLKVWDAHSGEVRLTLEGHTRVVIGCAVSPAGDFIVSASRDRTLKVWDAHSGEVRLILRGHTDWVSGCAVSPARDYIVSASKDNTLKVWDTRSGEVRLTLEGHMGSVTGCAVSPARDYIVSASGDKTLKVWDAHSGEVHLTLQGHTRVVSGCAVSPAGDFIVSASRDNTLKVWDAHSGEVCLTLHGHTDWVSGCAVSPAGDFIVSASRDNTLKVWDMRSGEVRLTLHGHRRVVTGCAVSPAGDFIVSASRDRTLKVWDAHSGEVRLTLEGHTDWVSGCAVSPAGDFIVSASRDNTLKVWDMRSGEVRLTLEGHTNVVEGCAVSPAGDFIVSASGDETLKVWDVRTGGCLATLLVNGFLRGCAWHADGEHVVAVGDGGVYFLRWVR